MTQISPYINFENNCREAMQFYQQCLGGDLSIQPVEGTPMEAQCPAAMKHQVLHAALTRGTLLLMGSDMAGPGGFSPGTNVALSVNCSSEEEINTFFTNLAKGGSILDPLKEQFWGAVFGCLTDKYGIRWMFNFDKSKAGAIQNAPQ